jgi:DNA-binding transcriptional MerR regulator
MEFVPKKLYYKIREVCEIVGVEAHVLRFWETEFSSLAPPKSKSGQRTYRPKDIELLLRIRKLLYEEGYTIAGARKQLNIRESAVPANAATIPMGVEDKKPLESRSYEISGQRSDIEDNISPITDEAAIVGDARAKLEPEVLESVTEIAATKEMLVVPAENPRGEKPPSERLKRVQAELENILTLLDRE